MSKIKNLRTQTLRTMLGLIKYPLITDKTTKLIELNKYSFIVDKKANKFTVQKVIEYVFNVHVLSVNTLIKPLKKKTIGRFSGYKSNYKKAIVTLKEGDVINLFPDI